MNLGKSDVGEEKLNCNLCEKFFACVLVLALLTRPVMPAFVWNSTSREWRAKDRISKVLTPEFEETDTRVVVMAGRDATLPCRISNLNDKVNPIWQPQYERGDLQRKIIRKVRSCQTPVYTHPPRQKAAPEQLHPNSTKMPVTVQYWKASRNWSQVSWIRTRDLHILTSGPVTFTADERFECRHTKGSSDWSLKLRKSQPADSGIYECQVNTDPKMNRKVTLDVVSDFDDFSDSSSNDLDLYMVDDEGISPHKEAMTRILGEEEQFVKTGSTITFTCLVVIPGETATSIDWLKNGRLVSFQASRGGIIVETEKSEKKSTSRLTLADVKVSDSGNYTCKPSNAKSHSIGLVVIEGEHTEAMQRNSTASERTRERRILSLIVLCLLIVFAPKFQ